MRFYFSRLAFTGLLFLLCVSPILGQTEPNSSKTGILVQPSENPETVVLRQRAVGRIESVNWKETTQNMNYQRLQNLEKWHQFPLGKALKSNPDIAAEDLKIMIQSWYNENPDQRAKVIVSL